jgi:CelD/BcsL family acetyltransferase involved in cellulose biosynthesis
VLDTSARPHALRFGGARFGDRFGVVSHPGEEAAVAVAALEALEAELGTTPMVVLRWIDRDSEWPSAMAAASSRRLAVVEASRAQLPHVSVAGLDWDAYVAGRGKKFRTRVARGLEKSMNKKGIEFAVRETSEAARLEADMATLFNLHDRRRAEDDSSITDHAVRASLTAFARSALARGWLRLRILEIEGQPAAAYLAWRLGPSYGIYQSGFDPAYAEQSAGMLLMNDTVRSAIAEDVEEVDLLLGGEAYKWRFAPDPREVHTVVLVGARTPARLLVSGEAAARRRARSLASRPRLGRALKRVATWLPGGR